MKPYLPFIYIAAGIVLGFILFKGCGNKCPNINPKTVVTYKYDTTVKTITQTQVKTVVKEIQGNTIILTKHDTITAINGFFTLFTYTRTFADTNFKATLTDTITQNAIKGAKFSYQILHPTQVTTTTISPQINRNKLFIGIGLSGSTTSLGITPGIALETKKGKLFTGGYDLINKQAILGAYLKIHFSK